MFFQNYNNSALLVIKLATCIVGKTPRTLEHGISSCIRIDNSICNQHLVSGVDYLVPSGIRESSIPFLTEEVKKEIYFEDITEITPIGADKLLITLSINGEIYEAYCSAIKYGVLDEVSNIPQYWKTFINLSGPDLAIEHLNKYYKHLVGIFVDSTESSSILSIEPYIEKDIIVESEFSDWSSPRSSRNNYIYREINKISIDINKLGRTISFFDSFIESTTGSDHDGSFETTEWTYRMFCTIKFGSIERLESQIQRWKEKGISFSDSSISFQSLRYWEIESKLGIKFSFSNSVNTFPI